MQPNENMDQLIETKLTKGEAIDLILEEMKEEIEKEREVIGGEDKAIRAGFKLEDFLTALRGMKIEVEIPSSYREGYGVVIRLQNAPLGKFPVQVQTKLSRLAVLHDQQEELGKKLHELSESKGKARNMVLKTMLEGSDQGKKFLELLTSMRLKVAPKLLAKTQKLLK